MWQHKITLQKIPFVVKAFVDVLFLKVIELFSVKDRPKVLSVIGFVRFLQRF